MSRTESSATNVRTRSPKNFKCGEMAILTNPMGVTIVLVHHGDYNTDKFAGTIIYATDPQYFIGTYHENFRVRNGWVEYAGEVTLKSIPSDS